MPRGVLHAQFVRVGIGEGEKVRCLERLPGGTTIIQKNRQRIAIGHNLRGKVSCSFWVTGRNKVSDGIPMMNVNHVENIVMPTFVPGKADRQTKRSFSQGIPMWEFCILLQRGWSRDNVEVSNYRGQRLKIIKGRYGDYEVYDTPAYTAFLIH